jgi:hypothetical protein
VEQVFIALVSVVIGAVLSAFLQYFFWKRQHRQETQSLEEREIRRERTRAAERFRETGILLIEISRAGVYGPHVSANEMATTTQIEIYRLRRELLSAAAAVRDLNTLKGERLNIFLRMTEKISQESASGLRSELDAIVAELRADVSISDK